MDTESTAPPSLLDLAGAIVAFARSQSNDPEQIKEALQIARSVIHSDQWAGVPWKLG